MAARRFTEGSPAVPLALRLSALPPSMHEELWDLLGKQPAKRTLEGLESALGDRDATRALLRTFPAYALLVLECICEGQGTIERRDLERALIDRSVNPSAVGDAIDYLIGHGLALPSGPAPHDHVTLIAPRAQLIAELVQGLSAPAEPPPEPPSHGEALERERHVLSVAALTGHRKVKWTRDGLPSKTSLKTFARGLGATEESVEGLLLEAYTAGLVVDMGGGPIEPDAAALRRAAEQGLSRIPESLLGTIQSLLPPCGWLSARHLLPRVRPFGIATSRDLRSRCSGSFAFHEHDGHLFVGRPTRPSLRTGDGHVTPSFEVMLGPDAHPDIAVIVGLFSELVRLDRVLTFKISEASVHAGLRSGWPIGVFLDALAATGRHGVPENVSFTVKDFAARVSTIRAAWVLQVPAGSAQALERELSQAFLGSPAPGIVLVSSLVSQEDVAIAMTAAGLKPISVSDHMSAAETPSDSKASGFSLPARPDSELLARVTRERELGFRESLRALAEAYPRFERVPGHDAERILDEAIAGFHEGSTPPLTRIAFGRLRELIRGVPAELDPWIARLSPGRAAQARRASQDPVALVPFASLPPDARSLVLGHARSWSELGRYCNAALLRIRVHPDVQRVLDTFPSHAIIEETERDERPDRFSDRIAPGPNFERDLRCAMEAEAVVTLATRRGTVFERYTIAPTSIVRRGSESVLLAEDLDTTENHAFPFSRIAWIDLDKGTLNRDLESPPAPPVHVSLESQMGRNNPCPCGSGKKYKRCHGAN